MRTHHWREAPRVPYTVGVADDHDAGIDKQKLLDEIVGTSGSFESVAPVATPPPPVPLPLPEAVSLSRPPLIAPLPVIVPKPAAPPKARLRILEFRNEVAALTLGVCGVIWSAIGIATHAWVPGGTGVVLLVFAIGVWAMEMVRDE